MLKKKVMVIGKNGQLARSMEEALASSGFDHRLFSKEELDIRNKPDIEKAFADFDADFCINCAAYTAVDKAEEEEEEAFALNSSAVYELAETCKANKCLLIHFSTDYVYDNGQDVPLKEDDLTKPSSVYGRSKREGEKALSTINFPSMIFRVSWLYAPWGNNFILTMLNLSETRDEIRVVYDQVGCPTYAPRLAKDIVTILLQLDDYDKWEEFQGIYNYSQAGVTSWFDVAVKTFQLAGIRQNVQPVTSDMFPRPAERPNYSVLNTSKLRKTFLLQHHHWEECLKECMMRIQNGDSQNN